MDPPFFFLSLTSISFQPENIMMDVDGHVKLTDFGLSKIVKASDKTHTL